ncbi:MAG: class I SAM-dependent methyltransferase, partial [Bacteroidia bacterium]|nr:class I SAM-dependent methyltransferase [Bacteroidia bacterium]
VTNAGRLREIDSFKRARFVIQDPGSFEIISKLDVADGSKWWDACAGAGGKSIALLYHTKKSSIELLATDVRERMQKNYSERLMAHGFSNFEFAFADLQKSTFRNEVYDGVIVDAPCSGSGTWHNSPESKVNFSKRNLDDFVELQKRILVNASKNVKKSGQLLYITCSVFADENEQVLASLPSDLGLESLESGYVDGYMYGADTFYYNLFTKN